MYTPEQLKKVAESLGWVASYISEVKDPVVHITNMPPEDNKDTPYNQLGWRVFNPLASEHILAMHFKMMETFRDHYLYKTVKGDFVAGYGYRQTKGLPMETRSDGPTPQEAILDAYINYLEQEKEE